MTGWRIGMELVIKKLLSQSLKFNLKAPQPCSISQVAAKYALLGEKILE